MHKVLYVVGSPGVGKTTAIRSLVGDNPILVGDTEIRWTLQPPYAFIGHYSDKMLSGGDQVARHANLMTLDYWKDRILHNSKFKFTIIDGEMFLWGKILEEFQSQRLRFIDTENPKYQPGGLHYRENRNVENDISADIVGPVKFKVGCIYLSAPFEVSLSRRRLREANAKKGDFLNLESHLKTANSKQLNFAQRFQEQAEADDPFFMDETDKPKLSFLKIDAENLSPAEITKSIVDFLETF